MFFKFSKEGKTTILIVHVNDIILTGDDVYEIDHLKKELAKEFEMKDLGLLRYFLGMEVVHSKVGIVVTQRNSALDLLKEIGMLGCKPIEVPIDPNHKIGVAKGGKSVDKERYQRLVGKLIYLSHTRLDIAFFVSVVSQFMHAPKGEHLEVVYKILKYLKKTLGRGLLFKKDEQI